MLKAAILALGLSGLAVSAAQAGPLFDSYQGLCVKTDAVPAAVLSTADAGGWMAIPDAMLLQLSTASKVDGAQGRMKSDSAGLSIVIVGHKAMPMGDDTLNVRFCAVAAMAGGGEAAGAELATWAAVPASPDLSKAGATGYAFTSHGGTHAAVTNPNDAQAKALLKSGRVNMAFSQEGKGLTLLAFAVPTM
jgi:hypothetical protein